MKIIKQSLQEAWAIKNKIRYTFIKRVIKQPHKTQFRIKNYETCVFFLRRRNNSGNVVQQNKQLNKQSLERIVYHKSTYKARPLQKTKWKFATITILKHTQTRNTFCFTIIPHIKYDCSQELHNLAILKPTHCSHPLNMVDSSKNAAALLHPLGKLLRYIELQLKILWGSGENRFS